MATENKKYIPALRFPEFQNDGEWIAKPIKDIAKTFSGGTPTVGNSDYYGGSIPFIRSGEITKSTTDLFITELGLSSSSAKIVEEGTILYALYGATSGEVAISKIRGAINQAILAIIPKSRKYVVNYIYYFLKHQKAQILSKYLQGGQGNLSGAIIDNLSIAFPCDYKGNISDVEQTKIADCFVSNDKEIDATKRKLELLKEHKKGLMQRLFPAKGKTLPELRFPEFQNDGEWNYEHGDILYESIVNKKHKSDLPILAITQDNGAIPRDDINYRVVVEDKSIEGYKVVEVGDFIISLRSFQGGIEYSRYKGLCSPAYIVLRKRHSTICDDFYRHYFKSFQYIQELNRNLEGIRDGKMVSYKQFADIKLPYPNYEEQCKIAKVLSSIDDVIQTHIDKISALELHKNGLMQQLFPKL